MNWNWETIKEHAQRWYGKTAQLLVFLAACFYLLACIVASKPVGAKAYVDFAHHCFEWQQPGRSALTQVYVDGYRDGKRAMGSR